MMLFVVVLTVAACGQADPTFVPGDAPVVSPAVSATPAGTPTRVTSVAPEATPAATVTTSRPAADWIELPADYTVRTAAQAASLAEDVARGMLAAAHPHVASTWLLTEREAEQANGAVGGSEDDPFALIWWVNFDNDRYVIPMCPDLRNADGTPEPCGSSGFAAVDVVAHSGAQPGLTVGRNYTPMTASNDVTVPRTARLRTEGEAIAAALQSVPGVNEGSSPQITNVRLMTARDWLKEQAAQGVVPGMWVSPDSPLWEVSLTNAAYTIPCLSTNPSDCVLVNVSMALDATSGDQLMYYGKPASAATPTP
jgi:hypothetical protein